MLEHVGIALLPAAATTTASLLAQQPGGQDLVSLFTSLGVGGLMAAIVYLWLRDVAKQRDKALESLTSIQPVLIEIQLVLDESRKAHQAGAEAAKAMTETLRGLPEAEVWFKLTQALERAERRG